MDVLLFIPDISGFTSFVNHTEIEHSRHIVAELLELVIDSDELGLQVAEIEGDAVFFYSKGPIPPLEAVVAQVQRTFVRFHEHLKLYESRRICQCGACSTANDLSLKFIAHQADVTFIEVHGNRKPYGPDVILAHRLLKNEIQSDEYLLATSHLLTAGSETAPWGEWTQGTSSYTEVGPVPYGHLGLTPLRELVKEPPPLSEYPRIARPVVLETDLPLKPTDALAFVSDLSVRYKWNQEADEIYYPENRVNRVGLQHQCIIRGQPVDFETIQADFGPDALVMGERVGENPLVRSFATFWIIRPSPIGSRLRVEIHFESKGPVRGLAFRLVSRRVLRSALRQLEQAVATQTQSLDPL